MAAVAVATIGLLALAPASFAAAPGCNLAWEDCSTSIASFRFCFPCDANDVTRSLISSFRPPVPVPDFVAVSVIIDGTVNDATVPPWWQLGAGECREGALEAIPVGTIAFCTNPYAGAAQGGGLITQRGTYSPRWFRIRADWARDSPIPIGVDSLYSGLVIRMTTDRAIDDGLGVCEGCAIEATLVLNELIVWGLNGGVWALYDPLVRKEVTFQEGLYCTTPARTSTWGAVKALYR